MPIMTDCCACACPGSGCAAQAYAAFTGSDSGVAPGGAHPNSDTAMAAFLAAAGGSPCVLNFESVALGAWTNGVAQTLRCGVVATPTNAGGLTGISNDNTTSTGGFNTTAGGTRFIRFQPILSGQSSILVTFDQTIYALGFYFTGVEAVAPAIEQPHILFDDGTPRDVLLARNAVAGVSFWGMVCQGIRSFTLFQDTTGQIARDIWGIDDMLFG